MGTTVAELVETGEKRDGRGRRIRPKEEQAEYVQAYRESGLTMAAFARREGLKYPTFAGWVLRSQRRGNRAPVPFAEVRLPWPRPGALAGLEVRLADGTVACGTDAAALAALVRALRD